MFASLFCKHQSISTVRRSSPRRVRLGVESLEDRTVPSTLLSNLGHASHGVDLLGGRIGGVIGQHGVDLLGSGAGINPSLMRGGAGINPELMGGGVGISPSLMGGGAGINPSLMGGGTGINPSLMGGGAGINPSLMGGGTGINPSATIDLPALMGGV